MPHVTPTHKLIVSSYDFLVLIYIIIRAQFCDIGKDIKDAVS